MAPPDHLASLLGLLCDQWHLCNPEAGATLVAKAHAFLDAAKSCPTEMSQLPSLTFHVKGSPGQEDNLVLTPSDYMLETPVTRMEEVQKWLMGVIPVHVQVPTAETETQCIPAFRTIQYNTTQNGPVWILGAPFFYKYSVAYDRSNPAIAFGTSGCAACATPQLMQRKAEVHGGSLVTRRARRSTLRFLDSRPFEPFFNTSLPL